MFNYHQTAKSRLASVETRQQILTTALETFRRRGMEAATMREIAKSAGVALGAAYYYFPSKEAIVLAYYDSVQAEHLARVKAQLAGGSHDLFQRLRIVFHTKLDILLPAALWAMHLGILLYFIYDDSPNQERTRTLCDGLLQLLARVLPLVNFPLLKPLRGSLLALLREAGLFAEPSSPAPGFAEELQS